MSIKVGILGLAQRQGTFAEVGLRSWEEAGGAAVERALVGAAGLYVTHRPLVIRCDRARIERILRDWCDAPNIEARCDLILTVGGLGLEKTDVMPEATEAVLDRQILGIAERLRAASTRRTGPEAALLRGVAGVRKQTLIVNLPGSDAAIAQAMRVLLPLLPDLIAAAQAG